MAIHVICLVKDEADIIAQTLSAAGAWADRIYVLDNGSTDNTWQIVNDLAIRIPAIVPFRVEQRPFSDSMRDAVFQHFRKGAKRGDWWGILDADEFFVDDPRQFLGNVSRDYNSVWISAYNYLFTEVELAEFEADPARFDGRVPWRDLLHHYVHADHSERRFFRHWWGLSRMPTAGWGPIYDQPIRMRHYMYRSPHQIDRRLANRLPLIEARSIFTHERPELWSSPPDAAGPHEWRKRLVPADRCLVDLGDDTLAIPPNWIRPASTIRPSARVAVSGFVARLLKRVR